MSILMSTYTDKGNFLILSVPETAVHVIGNNEFIRTIVLMV